MLIDQSQVEQYNQGQLAEHGKRFKSFAEGFENIESVLKKLSDFQVAIPSWALGTGGTRFGRFKSGGEPRSLEEKIEDVGLLHTLNRSSGAISLHIPWDIPEDTISIRALAAQFDLKFDAINSNTFQDQQ